MPSPFYRRSPGFSPRALLPVAACAALSLGLPQAVLATDVTIIVNTFTPVYGNSDDGGLTYNHIFNGNTLTIRNGASVSEAAYGGYSDSSDDVMNKRGRCQQRFLCGNGRRRKQQYGLGQRTTM